MLKAIINVEEIISITSYNSKTYKLYEIPEYSNDEENLYGRKMNLIKEVK